MSSAAAARVVNTAARYVGVREEPDGSNRGPYIDRWQRVWGMGPGTSIGPQPWCGMFASAVLREAGVTDVSHPATWEICRKGRERGWTPPTPVPGGLIVWCGTHVGILISEVSPGVWRTIEGNSGNAVAWRTRSLAGTTIVVSPELRGQAPAPPSKSYWLEDVAARPRLYGPWRLRANRERAIARLPKAQQARVRRVRTPKGRYAFLLGPRRLYGPWGTQSARGAAQVLLERRLGRRLRPFSRTPKPGAAAPEGLGQTV